MSARYHLAYLVGDHDAIYGEIVNISQKFCALIPKKKNQHNLYFKCDV
jgi:flavin reductase (DIM6/NTAB) family NADH-FMN oxidoreductase RutF